MSQHAYCFTLQLTLQAPLLSHTTGVLSFGYDMAMQRYNGLPAINGSLVQGNIREALQQFIDQVRPEDATHALHPTRLKRWFGDASAEGSNDEPVSRHVVFDYFWLPTKDYQTTRDHRRYRIGIDAATGTVEQGNLQVIESCYHSGETPVFEGTIRAWLENDKEADALQHWLQKACYFIDAIGALKGVGFGKVLDARIKRDETQHALIDGINEATQLSMAMTLDRPFCTAEAHLADDNRFVSTDHIPGNVIKGALANRCLAHYGRSKSQHALDEIGFDQWVVRHAQPVNTEKVEPTKRASARPQPLPLSLVLANGDCFDLAQGDDTTLTQLLQQQQAPLSFQPDWKYTESEAIKNIFNTAGGVALEKPKRFVSVRTAIDDGVADDSKLFSMECVQPEGFTWVSSIDLSALDNTKRAAALDLLPTLLETGLPMLGKTKAHATVALSPLDESANAPITAHHNRWIITSQSDARLLPSDMPDLQGTNGDDGLKHYYQAYWSHISNNQLTLVDYFTEQTLRGGSFYWHYYRKKAKDYRPEWLTNAGSVFILTATPDADQTSIQQLLEGWQARGLPVAADRAADNWQTDPFLPQNGFGEIAVNHPIHTQSTSAIEPLGSIQQRGDDDDQ